MTFARANPLGWGWLEEFHSAEANIIDINQSRSLDGFAGGTYNPSAAIILNNQLQVDATGAAGANVTAIVATGKGPGSGVNSTGGATDGTGVYGKGGATDGRGVYGYGTGTGAGIYGNGGATSGDGVYGIGGTPNGKGVNAQGTGAGTGVYGVGGGGGGIGGEFIGGVAGGHGASGLGVLTGDGLIGIGGATNGRGVTGLGKGNAAGVEGTGGATSGVGVLGTGGTPDGFGVTGVGTGAGTGVQGTGGATDGIGVHGLGGTHDGIGVKGEGDGNGAGVYGIGGDSDSAGGHFKGGTTNGIGVLAHATGTGEGVWVKRFAGAHIMLDMSSATTTDPAVPVKGQLWAEDNDDELIYYDGTNMNQLMDTWVHGTTNGTVTPDINDDNNVSGLTAAAGPVNEITVTFDRQFSLATYASVVTIEHATSTLYAVIASQAVGAFSFRVYNAAGALQDPTAVVFSFCVIVKGYFS
ncbi:MAG: hypothetical protein U9Q07_04290 [Planctomycetota bacterium]|nr:hypothetical protein [Planctomycetota bacterium]